MRTVDLTRAFLRTPSVVGSVTPSSRFLAARVADEAFRTRPATVVEVGAGDGAITRALLDRANASGARLVAVDLDATLLRKNDARGHVLRADAEQAPFRSADVVVSSLPFGSLSPAKSERILASLAALGGRLVLYQYTRRRFPDLRRHFPGLAIVDRVYLNVPPAYLLATP